jgi:ankyrin repeat protein
MFTSLIEKGAETNMTDRDGWSPLMEACKNASKMIIELLMEKGADTNHVLLKDTNAYGRFENFYCSCLTDIRRLMVVSGSKLKGRTPLILAVECNYPEIVTLVIDKGGDVNKSDIIGWTPLMQACQDKNEKLCDVLLQRGAYIDSSLLCQ